eukprot:951125-Pleurochrysis_carterae.AAC.2
MEGMHPGRRHGSLSLAPTCRSRASSGAELKALCSDLTAAHARETALTKRFQHSCRSRTSAPHCPARQPRTRGERPALALNALCSDPTPFEVPSESAAT